MSKQVQKMDAWDYFTHEQRNDEKHPAHYFAHFEDVFPQIEARRKGIVHHRHECKSRNREIIVCPRCKDERVESGHSYYHDNHCAPCSDLNRQEEYRRKNNERLTEEFPNKFGIIKVWKHGTWHYPNVNGEDLKDENGQYLRGEIYEQMYKTPCGDLTEVDRTTVSEIVQNHKCKACDVLTGRSKATVMKQGEVADLFRKGIDGKHTHKKDNGYWSRSNYRSEDGILWHYSTIEGLRLKNGKTVSSTQCWSAGFAKCSFFGGDYSLPLSTLEEIVHPTSDLRNMEMLDKNDDEVLIKLPDGRTLLFGHDENRPFLVQVPKDPQTIKEAYENLKPDLVKSLEDENLKRQGDLFFIPMNGIKVKDVIKTQYITSCKTYHSSVIQSWEVDDEKTKEEIKKLSEDLIEIGKQNLTREERLNLGTKKCIELYKKLPVEKRLERPQIFKTNHEAQELGKYSGYTVVRGKVRHSRRQHSVLDLGNTWHIVMQNLGIRSWQVPTRGSGGGGD